MRIQIFAVLFCARDYSALTSLMVFITGTTAVRFSLVLIRVATPPLLALTFAGATPAGASTVKSSFTKGPYSPLAFLAIATP